MRKVYLDLHEVENMEQFHELFSEELDFPDYYGANLDALYDCLTETDEDVCIGIYGPPAGEVAVRYPVIRQVLADAEEENRHLCIFFFDDMDEEEEDREEDDEWDGEDPEKDSDWIGDDPEEDAEMMGWNRR